MALRRWLHLFALCGALLVIYFVVPASFHLSTTDYVLRFLVVVLVLGLLAAVVTWQLRLQLDEGFDRRVDGLVVAVVAVVVTFAMLFYLLAQQSPSQVSGLHTRIDALYFTMATLTTVGYGDVHAVGQGARALVLVQMVFNVLFVTTAASLLSSRIRHVAAQRAGAPHPRPQRTRRGLGRRHDPAGSDEE